ncbi:MAG: hypothetical protein B6U69_03990, partial [Thermofilum sp. ex4484_15]
KVGPLPVPYFNAGGNNWTLICCIAMAISYYGFLSHPWEVASVLGKKYSEDANLREVKEYVESFYGRYLGFSLAKFPDLREAIQYMYLNLRSSVPIISSFKRVKGKALMIIGMDGASRLYVLDPSSPPGKPPLKLMTKFPPGPVYLISLKPRGIKPKPPKATLQLWINLIDKYGNWFKSVWDGEQPYGGCPLLPKGIGWEFKGKWSCPYLRGFPYLIFSGYAYGQDGNYQLYIEIYNAYTYKLVCRDKEGITVRNGVGYVNLRINPPPYPMPQAPYLVKVKLLKGGNTCDEFWFLFYAYGN